MTGLERFIAGWKADAFRRAEAAATDASWEEATMDLLRPEVYPVAAHRPEATDEA